MINADTKTPETEASEQTEEKVEVRFIVGTTIVETLDEADAAWEALSQADRDQLRGAMISLSGDSNVGTVLLPKTEDGSSLTRRPQYFVRNQTKEELRQIVRDMLSNSIFFSTQIDRYMDTGMVFMPIALGALSVPKVLEDLFFGKGEAPKVPGKPIPPTFDTEWKAAEAPPDPVFPEKPEGAVTEALRRKVKWGYATAEELAIYEKGDDPASPELIAWKAKCKKIQEKYDKDVQDAKEYEVRLDKEYARREKLKEKYKADCLSFEDRKKAAEKGLAEHEAAWKESFGDWLSQVGVLYEYYDKAGPRAINGYPIFFSCNMMSADDYERVYNAWERESKRRDEEFDV